MHGVLGRWTALAAAEDDPAERTKVCTLSTSVLARLACPKISIALGVGARQRTPRRRSPPRRPELEELGGFRSGKIFET